MLNQIKKINVQSLLSNHWFLLGAAILAASLLTFVIYQFLNFREGALRSSLEGELNGQVTVSVVVPTRDLPPGVVISSGSFAARKIPADLVAEDDITATEFSGIAGLALVKPVRRGTPIRRSDVAELNARGFSDLLTKGMRAITIDVDSANSSDRMLKPGDHVDLFLLASDRTGGQGARANSDVAQLLLSDIKILATGQDTRARNPGEQFSQQQATGDTRNDYGSITLSVTPTQAGQIALAQKIGSLRAILRNPDDRAPTPRVSVTEPSLFAKESADGIEYITGGRAGDGLISMMPADLLQKAAGNPAAASGASMPPAGNAGLTEDQVRQLSSMARALSGTGKTN